MHIIALCTYVHTYYTNTLLPYIYFSTLPTLELAGKLMSGLCL